MIFSPLLGCAYSGRRAFSTFTTEGDVGRYVVMSAMLVGALADADILNNFKFRNVPGPVLLWGCSAATALLSGAIIGCATELLILSLAKKGIAIRIGRQNHLVTLAPDSGTAIAWRNRYPKDSSAGLGVSLGMISGVTIGTALGWYLSAINSGTVLDKIMSCVLGGIFFSCVGYSAGGASQQAIAQHLRLEP